MGCLGKKSQKVKISPLLKKCAGDILRFMLYFSTKLTNFDALKGQNQIFTCPEESVKFWQVWLHFEVTFLNEEAKQSYLCTTAM